MDLNPVVIHLDSAIERKALITDMEVKLGCPIRIHMASDGSAGWADSTFSKLHVQGGTVVKKGAIGCYESHVAVLEEFKQSGDQYRLVLEDDVILFCGVDHITSLMIEADKLGKWDMIYIGSSNYAMTSKLSSDTLLHINSAYGTYAMLLKSSAIPKIEMSIKKAKESGKFHPSDWIYKKATESCGLIAYGPIKKDAICWYKTGIKSYVGGDIRRT